MNVALLLTLSRIVLLPVFVYLYFSHFDYHYIYAALVLGLTGVTDFLDGYVARKYRLTTRLGAFLDPVADKLVIVTALLLIAVNESNVFVTLSSVGIIGREVTVSALREWMATLGKRVRVAVIKTAKVKTVLQFVASILLVMFSSGQGGIIHTCAVVALGLSATLTLSSMLIYFKIAWPDLTASTVND